MNGAPEVRAAIQNGLPAGEIEALAVGAGMKTLRSRCLSLVTQGITTFDEFAKLRL
jgi:type II secretory ATPase GspE/PulE/Tfp pilus assembly ATPase PilB-like protein